MPENKVIIEAGAYAELERESQSFETFIELIIDTARLNYQKDGLVYDADIISAFLRTQFLSMYRNKLNKLKEKENSNE